MLSEVQTFFTKQLCDNQQVSHLGVAQVSLVEGDPGQLVALADVKHRHRVASLQQLLHQVSAQEAGASDYCTTLITLETITQTL